MNASTHNARFVALAIFAGALLPMQFATNSALAQQLHSAVLAAATSYAVGAVFLLILLRIQGGAPDWLAARRGPWWAWLGGVVGSAYVVGSVVLTRNLGASLATTLVIAAQIITAITLDHFGALGLERRPLNRARSLALGLVLLALLMRFWAR